MKTGIKSEGKQTEGQPFVHPPPPAGSILMSDISPRCSECLCCRHPDKHTSAATASIVGVSGEGKSKTSTRRASVGHYPNCCEFTGFSSVYCS